VQAVWTRVKRLHCLHIELFPTTGGVQSGAKHDNANTVDTVVKQVLHFKLGGEVIILCAFFGLVLVWDYHLHQHVFSFITQPRRQIAYKRLEDFGGQDFLPLVDWHTVDTVLQDDPG
jgi:hypothetical protein